MLLPAALCNVSPTDIYLHAMASCSHVLSDMARCCLYACTGRQHHLAQSAASLYGAYIQFLPKRDVFVLVQTSTCSARALATRSLLEWLPRASLPDPSSRKLDAVYHIRIKAVIARPGSFKLANVRELKAFGMATGECLSCVAVSL